MVLRWGHTKKIALTGLGVSALSFVASVVMASTPYLLPTTFDVTKDHVTVQAAASEDNYFVQDGHIRGAEYFVITPAGGRILLDKLAILKDFVAIDLDVPEKGTYKIFTGDQGGRRVRMAKVDGQWRAVRLPSATAPKPASATLPQVEVKDAKGEPRGGANPVSKAIDEANVPAGAEIVEVQTITRAETYISKGAPSKDVFKINGKGFEVKPVTHPNELYQDHAFTVDVLLDGQPLKDQTFSIYRGGNIYDDKKIHATVKSDAQGQVSLKFDRPGLYLMKSIYPAASQDAKNEKPAARRYVYTLTFEVTK